MLSTTARVTVQTPTTTDYFDALDYLSRMKSEGKYNENTVAVFTSLYPKEIDILVNQGYFKPSTN